MSEEIKLDHDVFFPPPWNINQFPEKTEGWIEFQKYIQNDPYYYLQLWEEFTNKGLCSICGNWGFIDTRHVKTAAGVLCGKLNYCICANGRGMKKVKWDIEKEMEMIERNICQKNC